VSLASAVSVVAGHVGDGGAAQAYGRVVPAEPRPEAMSRVVVPVSLQGRHVHASHERHVVVDDHDLLVVPVQRPLALVERAPQAAVTEELLLRSPHGAPGGLEGWQRRSGPEQEAYRHPFCCLGQQIAKRCGSWSSRQPEVRGRVPTSDVDGVPSPTDRLLHLGKAVGAVDEDVHAVAIADRGPARPPAAPVDGSERVLPPEPPQPPVVVTTKQRLEGVTGPLVQPVEPATPLEHD